jgi:hypothetical protein
MLTGSRNQSERLSRGSGIKLTGRDPELLLEFLFPQALRFKNYYCYY